MKLVDILARELKEWPAAVDKISQGFSCRLFDQTENPLNLYPVLSEDWSTAIVTRAQWQAAVDAMKAGEQAWNGEGLPPVGTVCEFQHRNAPNGVWHPTSIRYSSHAHVIYVDTIDNSEACFTVGDPCTIDFRPARTAEQIAVEERMKQLHQMARDSQFDKKSGFSTKDLQWYFENLYAAGWRKTEVPDVQN